MFSTSKHLYLEILEGIGGATALSTAIMLRYDDFSGLMHLNAEPSHFVNPVDYLRAAQAVGLFKKANDLRVNGIDPKQSAKETWWAAERQCYISNERLSPFLYGAFDPKEEAIADFLSAVAKKIRSWIGPVPPGLDTLEGRFGPGATFADKGRLTTVPDKMSSEPTMTPGAYWYMLPYLGSMWGRNNVSAGRVPIEVRGNRYATVPKTYKTDRAIAIEPAINVFYQLGLGTSIRRRLLRSTGWNLDTVQDVHRREAMKSSITEEFATLDLSSASDTVCSNLVKLLLPPAWHRELSALRSPFTHVDGKWVHLEKFSSMGNGFTFELETLIFAALSSTLLEKEGASGVLGLDLFVFGDDIIVPSEHAESVKSMLSYCGFVINRSKSFTAGPFRESCGGDFWGGYSVRPWFRKGPIDNHSALFAAYNGLYAVNERFKAITGPDLSRALEAIRLQIPLPYRDFFGPAELGDIVLHASQHRWRYRWKNSIRLFRALSARSRPLPWHHWKPEIVLACAVYGTGDGLRGVTPRDPPLSFVTQWVPFS